MSDVKHFRSHKSIKRWLASGIGLLILCAQETSGAAADLEVRLSSPSAVLLSSEGLSCSGDHVSPWRFGYSRLELRWKKRKPLEEVSVILAFQHPALENGRLICELSRAEVDAMLGTQGNTIPAATTVTNICALQCGGVKLADQNGPFVADGALTIAGRYLDSARQSRFGVQTTIPVRMIFEP